MCSYKLVTVKFEVWGLQSRVEQFVHKVGMQSVCVCVSYEVGREIFLFGSNILTQRTWCHSRLDKRTRAPPSCPL